MCILLHSLGPSVEPELIRTRWGSLSLHGLDSEMHLSKNSNECGMMLSSLMMMVDADSDSGLVKDKQRNSSYFKIKL